MDFVEHGRRAEATISTGDDVLASDEPSPTQKALRHQLRMLNQRDAMRYHTREENLPGWLFHIFEKLGFRARGADSLPLWNRLALAVCTEN
jgi:hypothetical protein